MPKTSDSRDYPRLELLLDGVDPDERRDHRDDAEKEHELDADRQPDEPPRPPRPRTALLAVSGTRYQLLAAVVAGDLGLFHRNEYAITPFSLSPSGEGWG